jgi:hypothetical protein
MIEALETREHTADMIECPEAFREAVKKMLTAPKSSVPKPVRQAQTQMKARI